MRSVYLLLLGLAIVCVVFSGCSDNKITGPDQSAGNDAIVAGASQQDQYTKALADYKLPSKNYETLLVTAHKVDIEIGCWIIQEESGKVFEPAFNEKCVTLLEGMKLKVYGWVDESIKTYCMLGPVFRVEQFSILKPIRHDDASVNWKDKVSFEGIEPDHLANPDKEAVGASLNWKDMSNSDDVKPHDLPDNETAVADKTPEKLVTLSGFYNATEKGCMFIELKKEAVAELKFANGTCPRIETGSLIKVRGEYSLLDWSPCNLGPLFNVYDYEVIKISKVEDYKVDGTGSNGLRRPPAPRKYGYTEEEKTNRDDF